MVPFYTKRRDVQKGQQIACSRIINTIDLDKVDAEESPGSVVVVLDWLRALLCLFLCGERGPGRKLFGGAEEADYIHWTLGRSKEEAALPVTVFQACFFL